MKVLYIADDGTQFDDQYDCEEYEWISQHPSIKRVKLYDADNNELVTYMSQDSYENADFVIVPDIAALDALHELARFTGFCCYHWIESPGRWLFNDGKFVKE